MSVFTVRDITHDCTVYSEEGLVFVWIMAMGHIPVENYEERTDRDGLLLFARARLEGISRMPLSVSACYKVLMSYARKRHWCSLGIENLASKM